MSSRPLVYPSMLGLELFLTHHASPAMVHQIRPEALILNRQVITSQTRYEDPGEFPCLGDQSGSDFGETRQPNLQASRPFFLCISKHPWFWLQTYYFRFNPFSRCPKSSSGMSCTFSVLLNSTPDLSSQPLIHSVWSAVLPLSSPMTSNPCCKYPFNTPGNSVSNSLCFISFSVIPRSFTNSANPNPLLNFLVNASLRNVSMVGKLTPVPTFNTSIIVCGSSPYFWPVTNESESAQMEDAMM